MNGSKEIDVKSELLKYLRWKKAQEGFRIPKVGEYYPSVVTARCMKQMFNYYRIAEVTREMPDSYYLHTARGMFVHDVLQNLRKEYGKRSNIIWDGVEVPARTTITLPNGHTIKLRGRADAVYRDCVYEFKAPNWIGYKLRWEYKFQINFYMDVLGKPKGKVIQIGNKSGEYDIYTHDETLSDWMTKKVLANAQNLHVALIHNEVPMCECTSNWHDREYEEFERKQKARSRLKTKLRKEALEEVKKEYAKKLAKFQKYTK